MATGLKEDSHSEPFPSEMSIEERAKKNMETFQRQLVGNSRERDDAPNLPMSPSEKKRREAQKKASRWNPDVPFNPDS